MSRTAPSDSAIAGGHRRGADHHRIDRPCGRRRSGAPGDCGCLHPRRWERAAVISIWAEWRRRPSRVDLRAAPPRRMVAAGRPHRRIQRMTKDGLFAQIASRLSGRRRGHMWRATRLWRSKGSHRMANHSTAFHRREATRFYLEGERALLNGRKGDRRSTNSLHAPLRRCQKGRLPNQRPPPPPSQPFDTTPSRFAVR